MKCSKPILKAPGHFSGMQTPIDALYPLVPLLSSEEVYFDCAAGKGMLVRGLQKLGFNSYGKDIKSGYDFITSPFPRMDHQVIITNPPYDQKDKFLKRAYELETMFAFLLPIESLGGAKRQEMYREKGIQLILFPYRINFITPNGGQSSWFPVAWFCWGFGLRHDLTFLKDTRPKEDIK